MPGLLCDPWALDGVVYVQGSREGRELVVFFNSDGFVVGVHLSNFWEGFVFPLAHVLVFAGFTHHVAAAVSRA